LGERCKMGARVRVGEGGEGAGATAVLAKAGVQERWWRRGDVCSTFRVRGLAAADTTATALVLLFGGRVEF
jgi:hypothetical protein